VSAKSGADAKHLAKTARDAATSTAKSLVEAVKQGAKSVASRIEAVRKGR
jgi:hypothetical protein